MIYALELLYMQVEPQRIELLQIQKERLELKVKRQAVQITRLEASRKTLRADNKQMRTQIAGYQIDR